MIINDGLNGQFETQCRVSHHQAAWHHVCVCVMLWKQMHMPALSHSYNNVFTKKIYFLQSSST